MYIPVPAIVAVGAVLLVLLVAAFRRRPGARDLIAPPRPGPAPPPPYRPPPPAWPAGAAPIGDLPTEVADEVRALLAADRKIEAIKIARAATGMSLADVKAMVERMG